MENVINMTRLGKTIMLILTIVIHLSFTCQADTPSLIDANGYAERWVLSAAGQGLHDMKVITDESDGSVNENIISSDFFTRYPDYTSEGNYQWLEGWIRECESEPSTIGDELVFKGGRPFICIREEGCLVYSEADDDSSVVESYAFGDPVWIIGSWYDWRLCVTDFSNWVYEDIPGSLPCGWVNKSAIKPLPIGIWGGSSDETIEAGHKLMITEENELEIYTFPDDTSEAMTSLPSHMVVDVYPCCLDDKWDNWCIVWYQGNWGYAELDRLTDYHGGF